MTPSSRLVAQKLKSFWASLTRDRSVGTALFKAPTLFVAREEDLARAVKSIEKASEIALDTEADSLHHYFEKLCLLQIGTDREIFVIDPLAKLDFLNLGRCLKKSCLILHGADFDLKMLRRLPGFDRPEGLFDTLLAAQFLGYPRPNLASLVEQHFGVKLPKTNQKADWSIRPLTPSMLEYAANDIRYLKALRYILQAELEKKKRWAWFLQSSQSLLETLSRRKEESRPNALAWRIRGWKDLAPESLGILRALWQWREEEARRRDRPAFKVFSSEQIVAAARWLHENGEDRSLWECPSLPGYIRNDRPKALEAGVSRGRTERPTDEPAEPKEAGMRWNMRQKTVMGLLKEERNRAAAGLGMDPYLLVSNQSLEAIVDGRISSLEALEGSGVLLPWQSEALAAGFGKALREMNKK